MSEFKYTPDEDIKVHEQGAINLICKPYQSHEAGLPEWIKNSSDAYARDDAPESARVILLIIDSARDGHASSISCLDFCGMTRQTIEDSFRVWADPEAATRGSKGARVQGGHGNGGKCYMTQMFSGHAHIHTCRDGRGNKYGVAGGSVVFGYVPDKDSGRDFPVEDLRGELESALEHSRCSLSTVEKIAGEALKSAEGFTLVKGVGAKGYSDRVPARVLVKEIVASPQMLGSLDLCSIHVVAEGRLMDHGNALTLPEIEAMPGAKEPRLIQIPETLVDPASGDTISTITDEDGEAGELVLKTSAVGMTREHKRIRNRVTFHALSGYIGFTTVAELDVPSAYRNRIYGECFLDSLEPLKQNDRTNLAESPLTRAVMGFVRDEIQGYAEEFEDKDKRVSSQKEKNALVEMNQALDKWKNQVLTEMVTGLWGEGTGSRRGAHERLPVGRPAKLVVRLSHRRAGLGVPFRPTLKFLDKDGRQVRSVPHRWVSDDTNVALVDEDLMIVSTFSVGSTEIYAETLEEPLLTSNRVPLEVVHIHEITLSPDEIEVSAGGRGRVEALCKLNDGSVTSDVHLLWYEENKDIARVSASGLVYGVAPGETGVTAGADDCEAAQPARVVVAESDGRADGDTPGRGFPRVILSEYEDDPYTAEPVSFSSEVPPVYQRPVDIERNIWWINAAAPLARFYLDMYGHDSREWRMYHLERYIEAMAQIGLVMSDEEWEGDWIGRWGDQVAEVQERAVAGLRGFIESGDLPGGE